MSNDYPWSHERFMKEITKCAHQWLHAKKRVCRNCGCKVTVLVPVTHLGGGGVARFGACDDCRTVLVESEHSHPAVLWFDLNRRFDRVKFWVWTRVYRIRYREITHGLKRQGIKFLKLP